jgi:cell division control protein 6
MMESRLTNLFEKFLRKDSLFADKTVLQANHMPDEIKHRDEQINQIANILAPALRGDKPSNLFIYGKTGSGKTLTIKYVTKRLQDVARTQDVHVQILYLNCKLKHVADTEYRLIAQLCRLLGKTIPPTGLPTDEVYTAFYAAIEKQAANVIIVLDEIDQLVTKAGDGIIYNLTRINTELLRSRITLVGLSNDLVFADNLDPRVKSSLSEEELVFPPYNAMQIQSILAQRSSLAFKENILAEGVVAKCAAYAAREHGDARRALELLRVAAELAERLESPRVELAHVDEAEEKIDRDRILELVKNQPKQFQATLYSLFLLEEKQGSQRFTGDVYEVYRDVCDHADLRPLTQRRVSDIIAELDMFGVITAKIVSKGRYGRTRELTVTVPDTIRPKLVAILRDDLGFV